MTASAGPQVSRPWLRLVVALALLCGVAAEADAKPARSGYFPPTSVTRLHARCGDRLPRREPLVDDFSDGWYGKHLRAAGEPSLWHRARTARQPYAALRFTWLRSFDPPVTVRVEWLRNGRPWLVARQLSGAGGYEPGRVVRSVDRALSPEEFARFRRLLDGTAALLPRVIDECDLYCDGAQWVIEAAHGGAYHFTEMSSPKDGDVKTVGLAMLRLTGWRFRGDQIY